jgi:adenylosuccinate lyase
MGHPDAHETVRLLTLESQKTGKTLRELLVERTELLSYWEKLTPKQREVLENPAKYIGQASQKAEKICDNWEKRLL